MASVQERIYEINDMVIVRQWTSDVQVSLAHLPRFWLDHDGRPAAAAVVAALIWKLCNA